MPKFPAVETQTQKIGNENFPKVGNRIARRSGNVIAVTMSRIAMEAKRKVEDWEKTNNGKVCSLKDGTRENKDSSIKVRENSCVFLLNKKLLMQSQTREAIFLKL